MREDERASEYRSQRKEKFNGGGQAWVSRGSEKCLFGEKAEEGRESGHGEGGDGDDPEHDRHLFAQPAQFANVTRAGFVVDDARRHEERRFIQRVCQNGNDQRFEGDLGILPDQGDEHAKL